MNIIQLDFAIQTFSTNHVEQPSHRPVVFYKARSMARKPGRVSHLKIT